MAPRSSLPLATDTGPPRRPPVGRAEQMVGWAILTLLAGMAVGVGLLQRWSGNPALHPPEAGHMAATPVAAIALPWGPVPAALTAMGPAETFDATTLADKINGKAELYLTAGFTGLTAQRFASGTEEAPWLELFVYDMRDARAAFAVYSAQRRPDGRKLDVPGQGYQSGTGLFAVRGARYGEVIASDAALLPVAEAWMADVLAGWPEGVATSERMLFPPAAQVPDSEGLIAANAFGFEGFQQVMTARLRVAAGEVMVFALTCPSESEARAVAAAYVAFLLANGGQRIGDEPDTVPGGVSVDLFGFRESVFAVGPVVAGVHDAEDPAAASEAAQLLAGHLAKESSP